MMKKLFLLLILFCTFDYSQTLPPPGCSPMYALDDNNDGFAQFDLSMIYQYIRNYAIDEVGFDLSGYTLQLYATEEDQSSETNPIPLLYTNVVANYQYCYLGLTYTGNGPEYSYGDLAYHFTCWPLQTVNPAGDDDGDSIINANEDLNGNGMLFDDDTDADGHFNFMDADDDNDGIATIDETGDANGNNIPDYLESALGNDDFTQQDFSLYPNPSSGNVYLQLVQGVETSIRIYDISGKTVREFAKVSGTVEVHGLASGIYFVKAQGNLPAKKLIVL